MSEYKTQMTFAVSARRVDTHGSLAHCKEANITLDTDLAGRPDAFNPAELLMAALAACIIKGIERVTPTLKFELRGISGKEIPEWLIQIPPKQRTQNCKPISTRWRRRAWA